MAFYYNQVNSYKKINTYTFFKKSTLYLYKSKYYLCLHISNKDIDSFKQFHFSIVEFGKSISHSELFERKLKEYGKVIFKTNAINNSVKHYRLVSIFCFILII